MAAQSTRTLDIVPSDVAEHNEASQELKSYLTAIRSYPERFAQEPYLSFEEHLLNVMCAEGQLPAAQQAN